jgi:hypothetical protein
MNKPNSKVKYLYAYGGKVFEANTLGGTAKEEARADWKRVDRARPVCFQAPAGVSLGLCVKTGKPIKCFAAIFPLEADLFTPYREYVFDL